jgi:hypothetical protein
MQDAIVEVDANSNTIDFRLHSTFEKNDSLREVILFEFEEISTYIRWVYDAQMNSTSIPIDTTILPVDEMYPFLTESLNDYYQRYMESSASILILIGPPGSGKTSWIRGFLAATDSSAMVTYDEKVLAADGLFSAFIDDSTNVLVIEDADLFLSSRKDGNDMMHRFLSVGDGLVSVKGKKIIFSTNLPNINDIDEALLRPGRCFDILHFDNLTIPEAKTLVNKVGIDFKFDPDRTHYSVAEIFSGVRTAKHKIKSSFGFSK